MTSSDEFCFWCGYNLTGLPPAHPCPECGHVTEANAAPGARAWFNGRSAWHWWLHRPARLPAGVWYALWDTASLRTARRRAFFLMWLPAILISVLVLTGNSISIDYDVKIWYHDQADPKRTPLRVDEEVETDRLFAFNLHLRFDLWWQPPANWVQVVERTPKAVSLTVPPEPDFVTAILGGVPWLVLLLGYIPGRVTTMLFARRLASRHQNPNLRRSAKAACSLIALAIGPAVWLWLALCLLLLLLEAGGVSAPASERLGEWMVWGLFVAVTLGLAITGVLGWPRVLALDHARIVFPWRAWLALPLAALALIVPMALGLYAVQLFP